ncbi:MAG: 7TMR-DISM family protein, partial [Leadbetterella sp.]
MWSLKNPNVQTNQKVLFFESNSLKLAITWGMVLFFSVSSALSQQIIHIKNGSNRIDINSINSRVLEDKSCLLGIAEVQSKVEQFHPSNSFNFGYSTSKYWIKIPVKSQTNQQWVLGVMASLVDQLELYIVQDGKITSQKVSGDKYPHREREFDLPMFGFKLDLPHDKPCTIYLAVHSIDTKQFTLNLIQENYLLKEQSIYINFWFFYFGLLFMMVVYNLFLYLSIFDKSYLYYVLYILNFIFAQLTVLGFGNQYIWGNYVWFANRTPVFFAATTSIFALLFAIYFLQVYSFLPKLKAYFNTLLLVNILLCIFCIIKPAVLYNRISAYMI